MTDDCKIGIVLVSDHQLFREGIRVILSAENDFEVLAEGALDVEAVRLSAEQQPDVLLLAIQTFRMSPITTIRQVAQVSPSTGTVVFAMNSDEYLMPSLDAGAAAYLSKDIGRSELCSEIRLAAADSRMFAARVPRNITVDPENLMSSAPAMTDREIEVLRLVSAAMSNSQIAIKLYISEATVKRHLTNIFAKLKARSRLDAVNRALALGMLDGPRGWPIEGGVMTTVTVPPPNLGHVQVWFERWTARIPLPLDDADRDGGFWLGADHAAGRGFPHAGLRQRRPCPVAITVLVSPVIERITRTSSPAATDLAVKSGTRIFFAAVGHVTPTRRSLVNERASRSFTSVEFPPGWD